MMIIAFYTAKASEEIKEKTGGTMTFMNGDRDGSEKTNGRAGIFNRSPKAERLEESRTAGI